VPEKHNIQTKEKKVGTEGNPSPSDDTVDSTPRGADRRMAQRVSVDLDVDYAREENYLVSKSASIINLSSLGIFIRTDEPSPIDTVLNLSFQPPNSDAPIQVEGIVAWANKVQGDNPDYEQNGMGIEFVNLDEETKKRLVSLVKRIALLAED